jgi:predicted amidophosphoribosyltransferase
MDESGCPACRGKHLPWERFVRLGEYDGLLRRVVCETKFTAWRRLGRDIGRLLGAQLADAMERAGVNAADAVIVPVPTTFLRRVRRGIDHTWCIARGVRDVTGVPIVPGLSRRNTTPQASLPKTRRATNVRGSMSARGLDLSAKTVIVLDDVRTTGATMLEACRALRRGDKATRPIAVWALVAAVTPDDRRRRELGWRDEAGPDDDAA